MPPWVELRTARIGTAMSLLGLRLLVVTMSLAAQSSEPTSLEITGEFQSSRIDESSGVAVSREFPGILWTHNDSDDGEWLYATNLHGDDLGYIRVRGSASKDWEDIALGPCPNKGDGDSCIYIADTGDNRERRRRVSIYVFPEPAIDSSGRVSAKRTALAHRLRVSYPDGPHDVEAMAVTPSGDVYLFAKGRSGPVAVYFIAHDQVSTKAVTAERLGTLPITTQPRLGWLVTAAAISPDGTKVAIRTYTALYFYTLAENKTLEPLGPRCWLGTFQVQGEAVDFLDESTVVLTSESALGRAGTIATAVCPVDADGR